jgi:hypothetical protein
MPLPTLTEWMDLPDDERARLMRSWNPYAGEGGALVEQIADRLRGEFGHLAGLEISGHGVYHGGSWVIGATHPFVFDRRALPGRYLGIEVRASVRPPFPREFEGQDHPHGYVWAPPNFERFVDRCSDQIQARLGPGLSRADMLHALIGRPFEEHLAACRRWVKEGSIPPFE